MKSNLWIIHLGGTCFEGNQDKFKTTRLKIKELFNQFSDRIKFLKQLQEEFIHNIQFCSKMDFELFFKFYSKQRENFGIFYGECLSGLEIFNHFDITKDGSLDLNDQLQFFTTILSKFQILFEELVFFDYYEESRKVTELINQVGSLTVEIIFKFRNKLDDSLKQEMTYYKDKEILNFMQKHSQRFELFQNYQSSKQDTLDTKLKESQFLFDFNKSESFKSIYNLKLPKLKNILLQEKMLGTVGNPREAINLSRVCQSYYYKEKSFRLAKLSELIKKKERFLQEELRKEEQMTVIKTEKDLKKIMNQRDNELFLKKKNLECKENILNSHLNFVSKNITNCLLEKIKLNQLRCEENLKKDFRNQINTPSKEEKAEYFSPIFKAVCAKKESNLLHSDKLKCLENLSFYKACDYQIKIDLYSFKQEAQKNTKSSNFKEIANIFRELKNNNINSQKIKICELYNDNLE